MKYQGQISDPWLAVWARETHLMTFTGNKSSETILGSHACRFDKLENFAITFWKKLTFTISHCVWRAYETYLHLVNKAKTVDERMVNIDPTF